MGKILKSLGITPSERYLGRLADRSFLSLWAYPNVYRDKAKELCDLLVVCGDHVLVFSDKSIKWPTTQNPIINWERWYRRAIGKSAVQLSRAIGWVRSHPDRLFLDPNCEHPFPIELPEANRMQIHGIIVARGAAKACVDHFGSGSGSLIIIPAEARTIEKGSVPSTAFTIGNPSSNNDVYHIFDDITLDIILKELDTIIDLSAYLSARARIIRKDQLLFAAGEEDLLAVYLKDVNEHGEHDFVVTSGKTMLDNDAIGVQEGTYAHYRQRGEYKRKRKANKVSYIWDSLIERFAENIIADTSYIVRGYEDYHDPSKRELGLRYLALTDRLERRMHSEALLGAFEKIGKADRFFRAMLPGLGSRDPETGFFILLLKRNSILASETDDDYRLVRSNILYAYAMKLLQAQPTLKRVIGISTEGETRRTSRSEDLIYAQQPLWTADFTKEVDDLASKMEIFKDGLPSGRNISRMRPLEYPPSHHPGTSFAESIPYGFVHENEGIKANRHERRRMKSRRRRL